LERLDILEILDRAISENRTVEMDYLSKGILTERLVDPYEIKDKKYIIGYCHYRNEMRTFRIDRIRELTVTDEFFKKSSRNTR
jgi:predicted DNA-binding transcriptional regulator YafY